MKVTVLFSPQEVTAEVPEGATILEAAAQAGVPPFRAQELARQVRTVSRRGIEAWLETLAGVDLALKGGSRRPPKSILEQAIIQACTAGR